MMTRAAESLLVDSILHVVPVSAPPEQRGEVRELVGVLREVLRSDGTRPTCELVGPRGERHPIPEMLFHVLKRVAEVLDRGDAITVAPVGQQLTTQQAANILNVSRQYLVRLLDNGRIPHTKTGKHRRLLMKDVLDYKERRDRERGEALADLTNLTEDVAGYPELK